MASSQRLASSAFVDCYAHVDYRRHYAGLLRLHPRPPEAIAELCLFRYWLACRAHHHAQASPTAPLAPAQPPPEWPLPLHAGRHDIQYELGGQIAHLLDSRFDLYDRFFTLGRHVHDPLGLDAATLALACQLFTQSSAQVLARLQEETRQLFATLVSARALAASV